MTYYPRLVRPSHWEAHLYNRLRPKFRRGFLLQRCLVCINLVNWRIPVRNMLKLNARKKSFSRTHSYHSTDDELERHAERICQLFRLFEFVSGEVLGVGAGVDQKIRNVNSSRVTPSLTRATTSAVPNNNQFYLQDWICARPSQNQETLLHQFDVQRPRTTHSFFSENSPNLLLIDAKKIG